MKVFFMTAGAGGMGNPAAVRLLLSSGGLHPTLFKAGAGNGFVFHQSSLPFVWITD
jgi:hypothetical protein